MKKRKANSYLFEDEDGIQMCDKASPLAEFRFRFEAYTKLAVHAVRHGLTPVDLLRSRYPYRLPDPARPQMISLELNNFCNLRCRYCPIDSDGRNKGFMSANTFEKVLAQLVELKVPRVHVRGWGEPTLHPEFAEFMKALACSVKFVDVVSNGQWEDSKTIEALLSAPVNRVDISVDVGGAENYEKIRVNGNYELLINNLKSLKDLKRSKHSDTIVIVRTMFGPSQVDLVNQESNFWRQYADAVMPAPLFHLNSLSGRPDAGSDLYTLTSSREEFPRCYFPFNELTISWNGDVPLCDNLVLEREESTISIGNINNQTIREIWQGPELCRLRRGHKNEINSDRQACRGCPTC